MSLCPDIFIKNILAVAPRNGQLTQQRMNIAIEKGKIISPNGISEGVKNINGQHLLALPGVIDTQVHFRQPGGEHKEDMTTGSYAAVAGGVTSFLEMPNTSPPTTGEKTLKEKMSLAAKSSVACYGFYLGATASNHKTLHRLSNLAGCCGTKIFMGASTGDLLFHEASAIEEVLRQAQRPVAVHAEDTQRLLKRLDKRGQNVSNHPLWRDTTTALLATQRLIGLAKKTGKSVHILHISSEEEVAFLQQHKAHITLEITPQHLTFYAPDCYDRLGTYAQMNPPLREKHHREALWKALEIGVFDVIGSDHAPHTQQEKDTPYPESPSGMPGVQTLLPVMLNWVHKGRISLPKLVHMTSWRPAELFRIKNKGQITSGFDADLVLVDMKKIQKVGESPLYSKCGWSPFHGIPLTGWPVMTIVAGKIVMEEGFLHNNLTPAPPLEFL